MRIGRNHGYRDSCRGRVSLGAVEEGSPKRIVRFGNGGDDMMHWSLTPYLGTKVAFRQFVTLPRTVEHRHQSVNTARIGGRVIDALQNLSVVHQDVAQRTRRIVIYAIGALIAAGGWPES
jgi:hypothetical protein